MFVNDSIAQMWDSAKRLKSRMTSCVESSQWSMRATETMALSKIRMYINEYK